VTILQAAFTAAVAVLLAGWCLWRAVTVSAPSVASVYRRLYGERSTNTASAVTSRWERPNAAVGQLLAATATGQRLAERRVFELRVADVSATAVATRVVTAAVVGFVAAVVAVLLPVVAGVGWPWWLTVVAPFVVAGLSGWYQYTAVTSTLARSYGEFRAGVAAYIALVSVCLTTRRSATEAVHYAAEVGTGKAFEAIAAAVRAAPQMGLQAWEALDAVGAEYGARELEDLATSIANVATVGVGVESTVVAVAARMRQVGLDEMQRQADRQTAAMFGPTLLFVVGTVAFLAYPLAQRVLDAFTNTTT
jgi:hypothetical protein